MKKSTLLLLLIVYISSATIAQTTPIFHISADQGFVDLADGRTIRNIGNVSIVQTEWGGKAFLFNGSNYLEVLDEDNSLGFVGQFTIEMVVKTSVSQEGIILSKSGFDTYPKNLILGTSPFSGGDWFTWGVGGVTSSGPPYQVGEYKKVVFICDGENAYYACGGFDNRTWTYYPWLVNLSSEVSDDPLRIGAGFSTAPDPIQTRYFNGEVCEVKIYDRILEPSEITPIEIFMGVELVQGVYPQDYNALVALYNLTNEAGWTNHSGWLQSDVPVSQWYGVTVDEGRVTKLVLRGNNLKGNIPPEIGLLNKITELYLDGNQLYGNIPAEIGNLTYLGLLYLSANQLTGNIPAEIGQLTRLSELWLAENQLSGSIPKEIGNLVNLDAFALHMNNLTDEIPSQLGNLTKVRWFNIGGNKLTGTIPPELGRLNMALGIGLSENQLSGTIPIEFGNLTNLWGLNLHANNLSGIIPIELCQLNLNYISLHGNNFDAESCPAIQCLINKGVLFQNDPGQTQQDGFSLINGCNPETEQDLQALIALFNATGGQNWTNNTNWNTDAPIYHWFGVGVENGRVVSLNLSSNNLNGNIPPEFFNLPKLRYLELYYNNLSGLLPAEIGNFTELQHLNLHGNNFEGQIPEGITNCTKLNEMHIGENNFSGPLPSGICNLPLTMVNFVSNYFDSQNCPLVQCMKEKGIQFWTADQEQKNGYKLTFDCGIFPYTQSVAEQDSLALVAFFNSTGGENWNNKQNWLTNYPVAYWHGVGIENGRVVSISLPSNNLNGNFPPEFFNLTKLRHLEMYYNILSGTLPGEIGNFTELQHLNIHGNNLEGQIPEGITNCTNLNEMHIGENNFSGPLPSGICNLPLTMVNFVSNYFDSQNCPLIQCMKEKGIQFWTADQEQKNGYKLTFDCGIFPYTQPVAEQDSLALVAFFNSTGGENWNNKQNWLTNYPVAYWHGVGVENGRVVDLSFNSNNLSGSLPPEFCNLTALRRVMFNFDNISGELPSCIGNLSALQYFNIHGNNFEGQIPEGITNCTNLNEMHIGENNFSGPLPSGICNLPLTMANFVSNYFDSQNCPLIQCMKEKGIQFWTADQEQKNGFRLGLECEHAENILLADFPFNGDAIDYSGNNYNGILNGDMIATKGHCNDNSSAWIFDRVNDFIEVPGNCLNDLEFGSIEVILKLNEINSDHWFFCYGLDLVQGLSLCVDEEGSFCYQLNGLFEKGNSNKIETGKWYYLVITWNGLIVRTYINGVFDKEWQKRNEFPRTHDYSIIIGADTYIRQSFMFNGEISDVKIYRGTLKQDEICNHYNELISCINTNPEILSITAPVDPINIINTIEVSAEFNDNNLESAIWNWGDGTTSQGIIGGMINGNHKYTAPGVYVISLTIIDEYGLSAVMEHRYVVIYDPDGGFVTGGGWIISLAGASVQFPEATGKAEFGFVSKYKKGNSIPTGNTEFKFKAGDLSFKSTEYEWLVIAGSKAKYKGKGTINGAGNYGFMISAIDGDLNAKGSPDLFRIKIWNFSTGVVVYDNQMGASETDDPVTLIGGGSIVIHNSNTKSAELIANSNDILTNQFSKLKIYPNPVNDILKIEGFNVGEVSTVQIIDIMGRCIYNQKVSSEITEIDMINFASGIYNLRIYVSEFQSIFKVIKK